MITEVLERRRATRTNCSGAIWWQPASASDFRSAWLVDRSHNGVAFLTRGVEPPVAGALISLSKDEPGPDRNASDSGLVHRVSHVQADIYLVGAQLHEQPQGAAN